MNMGKQIRENRLRCNLTQDKLAEVLGVTPQAVSKWESGAGFPDITLLPELSSIFGVKIDELFDFSVDDHLNRIENMLEKETMLSRSDFDYAMSYLTKGLENPEIKGRCLNLLANFALQRSQGYADMAADYAKRALEVDPEKKDNHSILCKAQRGAECDWCCANHTELINYYKNFVEKNPDYFAGYLWLADNLIADHRLAEARKVVEKMRSIKETYHYPLYLGWIAYADGRRDEAEEIWKEITDKYPDNWVTWFTRADTFAHRAMYDEAIALFKEGVKRQKPPRFTDGEDSIAQISMLKGDYEGAIKAYENVIEILREDWKMTEGETVRGYEENIERCREKLKREQK